ncbi:ABC transporter permease [Runella zeae]|uniref:ABC transporter permease n=1 Tax=Runella zeae TaxID=94255 RepID=UPI000404E529|nr:ABC transporter permease [Runella zeae]
MLRNYLKIAFRNLWQNKVYSFVNLSGLTLGLTVVMLIMLYVKDDLSFDRMHAKGPQIFRLIQDRKDLQGNLSKMGNTGMPQGPAFVRELGDFEAYCRFKNGWNTLVRKGNEGIKENLMYTDNSALTMFSFEVLAGDARTALKDLKNVVITDRMAEKYFGSQDPVGKIIQIGDEGSAFKPFVVAAVVKHPPANSSIQFDMLMSIDHLISPDPQQRANDENWFNASLNTFLLVNPKANVAQLGKKMEAVTKKYTSDFLESVRKDNSEGKTYEMKFKLQPLYEMHLNPEYYASNGLEYWSNERYPKILTGLALLVLVIACINFVNLTLARSLKRAKEIGIRKATGGTRNHILSQFLGESFLLTALAFIPSLLLAYVLLPTFSDLTDKHLESTYLFQPSTLALFGGLLFLVALLAGFYPALVLSGFRPMETLRGQIKLSGRQMFGKALVVFQFVLAGVLIIGTVIAARQFDYITHAELGYKTDNILRFWLPWDQIEKVATPLKHDLAQLPYVEKVSSKSGDWNSTIYQINGKDTDYTYYEYIDENHLQLMGIPLVKGRYFSSKYALDTVSNIIVNEAFVREFVPKGQDPFTLSIRQRDKALNIVGIVKDFHYDSFKEKIKPIVWARDTRRQAGCIHIQLAANHQKEALAQIKNVYKKYVPYLPLEYYFLEDFRMQRYADDLRWKQILTYTSLVAILIACLGLFGLATFVTEQRTKEIGIRKVLGAGVTSIVALLSKDFLKLVFIGIAIACPVAYYFGNQWLQDFAYRIEINAWIFVLAGSLSMLVALGTVAYQAFKTALSNPVKTLKTE